MNQHETEWPKPARGTDNLCVISHEATCGPLLFNIKEGRTLIPDPEGDDLPDESAAYREIRAMVDDVLKLPHVYGDLHRWARREFVVTDESGRTVMTINNGSRPRSSKPRQDLSCKLPSPF